MRAAAVCELVALFMLLVVGTRAGGQVSDLNEFEIEYLGKLVEQNELRKENTAEDWRQLTTTFNAENAYERTPAELANSARVRKFATVSDEIIKELKDE